jgi:hypothetical protein
MSLIESTIEEAALEWFAELGYAIGHGPEMAPGEVATERKKGTNIERRMEDTSPRNPDRGMRSLVLRPEGRH